MKIFYQSWKYLSPSAKNYVWGENENLLRAITCRILFEKKVANTLHTNFCWRRSYSSDDKSRGSFYGKLKAPLCAGLIASSLTISVLKDNLSAYAANPTQFDRSFATGGGFTGTRYIGITMLPVTGEISASLRSTYPQLQHCSGGVLVHGVQHNSPAHLAGLQVGDVILKINGEIVQSVDEVKRAIARNKILEMEVYRNGEVMSVKVYTEVSVH
ncbi:unnamed protein product [Clavelina lepadiformis]|uniref:PDZ domain-containing protein n=1 Tax=Clavelina lepadiformis TaxID=159417 RepID=A0ABP0EUL1_CLALP